jgi:hypothetical protein
MSWLLPNQQPFCLKQKLKLDQGFHRTPRVLDCLKTLQYILPRAAGAILQHLSNELLGLGWCRNTFLGLRPRSRDGRVLLG